MRESANDVSPTLHCLPRFPIGTLHQKCVAVRRAVCIVELVSRNRCSCPSEHGILPSRQRDIPEPAKAFSQCRISGQQSRHGIAYAVFSSHRLLQVQKAAAFSPDRDTSFDCLPQGFQKRHVAAKLGQVQFRITAAEIQAVQIFRQGCIFQRRKRHQFCTIMLQQFQIFRIVKAECPILCDTQPE